MFEKFLDKKERPVVEKRPRVHKGPPRKPDHELSEPRRKGERYDENGRVKKKYAKRNNTGNKHWTVRRKKVREGQRKARKKTNMRYERAYNATLRRKYIQNRSVASIYARKHGLHPEEYYKITYEDWLRLWLQAEDVWRDGKFWRPTQLADNPIKRKNDCCYFDRRDRKGAFSVENCAVFYRGKPLKQRIALETPEKPLEADTNEGLPT